MLPALMFILFLLQDGAPGGGAPPPASSWSSAADLELVTNERDSLRGVTRVAVTVSVPEATVSGLDEHSLTSTITFQLEQAGLVVATDRNLDDPVLSITIRMIREINGRGSAGRFIYRAYADLLQLVRLPDFNDRARLMMASTWHAGSFGVMATPDADVLRSRVGEVVNALLSDHRAVNDPASPIAPRPVP